MLTTVEQARRDVELLTSAFEEDDGMRIGVYSDRFPSWIGARCSRGAPSAASPTSSWASAPGGRGRARISISPPSAERRERDRLAGELREFGMRLSAVNAAGNLLHPDPAKRGDAQARFRAAVDLAVALGVERVITMSGCPAGPGGGALGVFPCWATSADYEKLFDWQIEHELGPFWRSTSDWLAKEAPR